MKEVLVFRVKTLKQYVKRKGAGNRL